VRNTYKISQAGLAIIKASEGLRFKAYPDPASPFARTGQGSGDPWTIGYGHTGGVAPTATISEDEATVLLQHDVGWAEDAVNIHVTVFITQHEFDACCSLAFNIGAEAFANSTLLKCINKNDFDGAADNFAQWVHAEGHTMAGMVTRRAAEKALFQTK
jgi:lysozyme